MSEESSSGQVDPAASPDLSDSSDSSSESEGSEYSVRGLRFDNSDIYTDEESGGSGSEEELVIPPINPDDFPPMPHFIDFDEDDDEDDYFEEEYEPLSEEEGEGDIIEGIHAMDSDDEVVIIEPPGEQEEQGHEESDNDNDSGNDEAEETDSNSGPPSVQNNNNNQASEEEEEEEEVIQPPPRKQAKMDNAKEEEEGEKKPSPAGSSNDDEDHDGFTCSICYEDFTNAGEHRISCLRCGHVFGKNCIEKWIGQRHGSCPQCKSKAKRSDIRVLYVKSLQAVDNTELNEARQELHKAKITIANSVLDAAKLKLRVESLEKQVEHLERESTALKIFKKKFEGSNSSNCSNCKGMRSTEPVAGPSSSTVISSSQATRCVSALNIVDTSNAPRSKSIKFTLAKVCEFKDGACRVGAYNEALSMLVVSQDMKNPLFPGGCCGIRQVNMIDIRPTVSVPLHQKQIRDMQFSPSQNDVLLTVAMDKKANLVNCSGNVTVQTFQSDYPIWSCAWDQTRPHNFFLGCSNGSVIAYDIRFPSDVLATFRPGTGEDRSPVCRMKFVTPTYQSSAFNLSGLLIQKLNSLSFAEFRNTSGTELRFHPLPVEGPFVSVDFEPVSRHMLLSTRPKTGQQAGSHLLCDMGQYYSEDMGQNVITSNVIKTYEGSNRDGLKMSRPSIFKPDPDHLYVIANGPQNTVRYWDVETSLESQPAGAIVNEPDYVLDFIHGKVNASNPFPFLGLVSEKGLKVFSQIQV